MMPYESLKILGIILFIIFIIALIIDKIYDLLFVWDYADVEYARPYIIIYVKKYDDISDALLNYPDKKISIAGGKFSHGGHTFYNDCVYLDMIGLNKILMCNIKQKIITVQSGITWRKILEYLDKYNMSVKAMQSYANFTVGGSISVNAHGRGVENSTVGSSVIALRIMLANGTILNVVNPMFQDRYDISHKDESGISVEDRNQIFRGVLGGYGGIAIILEATLSITDNYLMKKKIRYESATSDDIFNTLKFLSNIKNENNNKIVLYNGLIYPQRTSEIFNIYYEKVMKPGKSTNRKERLQVNKTYYWGKMLVEQILRRSTILQYCRAYFEPILIGHKNNENIDIQNEDEDSDDSLVFRNWEFSYDTNTLACLLRFPTTTVLQEYFIPIDRNAIYTFFRTFHNIMEKYEVNLLNISLRYVSSTIEFSAPILDYAPQDRLAVVIYYNIGNNSISMKNAKEWTQRILNVVTGDVVKGSYYLPYLPFASLKQFRLAYPNYNQYVDLKNKWDPDYRFSSKFICEYLMSPY